MFTRPAKLAFLELSAIAFLVGLMDAQQLAERLRLLLGDEQQTEPDKDWVGEEERDIPGCTSPGPPLLHFGLSRQSGLGDWVFTIGDPDPLPSIPHGHWQHQHHPKKLDPYTGRWSWPG